MSEQPSIKKNFAYKSALTLSNYLMAFITFPYVSRVLGVERIGLVNFVDNTVGYFLLFATLGVNILGVREIAAAKNNKEERNKVFSNIIGMNIGFTIVTLIAYVLIVMSVPKLNQYSELFFIGAAKIIFTAFLVEWFFTGIENFKYITLRSLAIKSLYVIAVFLFVKTRDDYKLYFIMTVGTVVLNALINSIYVRRFVKIVWREIISFQYIKQNGILGIYSIMTSMYLTFNVMFLGLVSDNTEVGYYTTAFKVYMVVLGLFSAFTNVMLPRMSALLAEGKNDRFQQLVDKSFRTMCTFCIPMIVCSAILAPQIIYILSGPGYEGAVTPMRIIMPAALFVGIAQVLAMQILMPMKKDRTLFAASIIGASISIIINFAVVPQLQSIGSAIVLLSSEIAITVTYIAYIEHSRLTTIPYGSLLSGSLLAVPTALVCLCCQYVFDNLFIILIVSVLLSACLIYILLRYNRLYYAK